MKYLLLLLLLAGCAKEKAPSPAKNTKPEAVENPYPEVDLSLEAFTNYSKYFKQSPRYPFIRLKDGKIDSNPGEWQGTNRHLAVKFKNTGKVLAYTNDIGGVIINDEEILVTADEMEEIYNTNLPFFTEEEYPSWTIDANYQNRLYRYLYDHGLADLKKLKPLAEGKNYMKLEDPENTPKPKAPKALSYLGQLDLGAGFIDMFLYTIADEEEQRKTAWYFGRISDPDRKGAFTYSSRKDPSEIFWAKKGKLAAEALVFDTPEKIYIRMLNLIILDSQGTYYDLIYPEYMSGNRMADPDRTFRF